MADSIRGGRFLVDAMLGNIARKLRIMGYDAAYSSGMDDDDDDILESAAASGRVIITRDAELARRAARLAIPAIYVSGRTEPQAMSEVVRATGITTDISGESARCPVCNLDTARVDPGAAAGRVPDGVAKRTDSFWECAGCGRVYWEGTHITNLREASLEWRSLR